MNTRKLFNDILTLKRRVDNIGDATDLTGDVTLNTDSSNVTTVAGQLTASVGLNLGGDLTLDEYIYHNGDANTYIRFTDDDINFQAGGVNFIDLTQGGTSEITFNEAGADVDFRVEGDTQANLLFVDASTDRVGIGTSAPEAYLDIRNTTDDGTTNRTMLRLHNDRSDDADVNDFGPISIDFVIENAGGGAKEGLARIAAVSSPAGTDHSTILGEKTSGLIFSTMNDNTLAEAMRINHSGYLGIGTTEPVTALDIHHDPTGLSNDTGGGEVVTFGTEDGTDTLAAGKLMYLNSSGVWKYTDADAAGTSGGVLLAIALGTAVSDGLLIRGFFDAATLGDSSSFVKGGACYVGLAAGTISFTAPSTSGDIVRVVGHGTDLANVIYFAPSPDYIEL